MSEPKFWNDQLSWTHSGGGYHRLEEEGPATIAVTSKSATLSWYENHQRSKRSITGGPYQIDIWSLTDENACLLEQNHTLTLSNCTWEMHWMTPTFGIDRISNVGSNTQVARFSYSIEKTQVTRDHFVAFYEMTHLNLYEGDPTIEQIAMWFEDVNLAVAEFKYHTKRFDAKKQQQP